MNHNNRYRRFYSILLAVILIVSLGGCSQNSWIQGQWSFNRKYTEEKLPQEQRRGFAMMLLRQLDGATLQITEKQIIATSKQGTGNAYEIIDHPTADSWRAKDARGKITTYYREGEWLATSSSGLVQFKAYFEREDTR